MSRLRHGLWLLGLTLLLGCAGWFQSDVTKLDLRLTAAADLNPDLSGRPSPLVVRIYELKAPAIFQNADFFALYEHDREILGMDLVNMEELLLTPGQQRDFRLALADATNYLAVMAAYRDIEGSTWRHLVPVQSRARNARTLVFQARGIAEK